MTVRRVVFLYCDGPGCVDHGESETHEARTILEARTQARKQGWLSRRVVRKGKLVTIDLCSDCAGEQ